MNTALIVCLFLSMTLVVVSLMVMHLQRQRRGLREILRRVLNPEVYHAKKDESLGASINDDSHR